MHVEVWRCMTLKFLNACRRYTLDKISISNLNYMFHTSSHDNYHLCFNPWINDDLMVLIDIYIFLSELWPLCGPLPWPQGPKFLHVTLRLTIANICAKLYWNPFMHVEVLLRTSVFQWPLSVTLTFDLETWLMRMTLLLILMNMSMKLLKFQRVGDMLRTKIGRRPPAMGGNYNTTSFSNGCIKMYAKILINRSLYFAYKFTK
jgi:hypothetical protein